MKSYTVIENSEVGMAVSPCYDDYMSPCHWNSSCHLWVGCILESLITITVLEITVGHRTLSDQISKMSDQFCHMVGQ